LLISNSDPVEQSGEQLLRLPDLGTAQGMLHSNHDHLPPSHAVLRANLTPQVQFVLKDANGREVQRQVRVEGLIFKSLSSLMPRFAKNRRTPAMNCRNC